MAEPVTILGAGLAGCEAAWQLAQRGIPVTLREMKPEKMTPAHHSPDFAELVCSNSLRSDQLENAVGLLKEELRRLGSLILGLRRRHTGWRPGGALAVDRHGLFPAAVTEQLRSHPNITVEEGEVTEIPPEGQVIVATGPLTSDALAERHRPAVPGQQIPAFLTTPRPPWSPLSSVDMDSAWFASRYDKGTADYINCPLDRGGVPGLLAGADARPRRRRSTALRTRSVFEGCMPVEVMARRGVDTLRYGPLKPVGLRDPKTGQEPYAVVQLRQGQRRRAPSTTWWASRPT